MARAIAAGPILDDSELRAVEARMSVHALPPSPLATQEPEHAPLPEPRGESAGVQQGDPDPLPAIRGALGLEPDASAMEVVTAARELRRQRDRLRDWRDEIFLAAGRLRREM